MLTASKAKELCFKKNMTFQTKTPLKNKGKSVKDKHFSPLQNGTVVSNISEFPMNPFKGTKSYLGNLEESEKTFKSGKKRKAVADFKNEVHLKKEKMSECDPFNVMSKFEQFSDIWNDCPTVENPVSNFEIVPNHRNEEKTFNKEKNFEKRAKISKETETSDWSISNKSRKVQNVKSTLGKSNQETNDHDQNSYENKSGTEIRKNTINKFKDQVSEDGLTISGKYDSKLAEMKRKKAVEEQSKLHADQKNLIKKALSSMDSKQRVNKKIVFSDAEDNEENQTEGNQTKNQKLFEDDDFSDADFELKVNSQFEGKKGQKLLELQSKFASDSRFALDSRFHDSESENEKDEAPAENVDINEEKKRQLEILESVVKQPIRPLSETRKLSGKKYDEPLMVRFDPTRDDHQKYLLKPQKPSEDKEELIEKKIKKSKKQKKALPNLEESKPEVSSEKIYAVKEDLKEALKKENKTEFSLLKLFGSKDEDSQTQQEGSESVKKLKYATRNPFRYDSSESETEETESRVEENKDKNIAKSTLPSWRTTFFFTANDSRLKEAEEFLKGPEEHEGDQEFAEKRKMLKDFIRHKLKNSNRKKDPFKKKLGGVKKKVFQKKKGK